MNDLIAKFLESLRGTSAGTKLVAVLSAGALFVIIGLSAVVSNKPSFHPAFYGLDDHDVATVSAALAEGKIPFEVSGAGTAFTVSVDEDDRRAAYATVYGAGALDKPLRGILSEGGIASVFNSAEERRQGVRKREWDETELILEELDFVIAARVRTSEGRTSPIERSPRSQSAAVTLRTRGRLTHAQGETVALIVSKGLGIERSNLVISDQEGRVLFDGDETDDGMMNADDAREFEAAYDERLAAKANDVLEKVLGKDKARVVVTTDWTYEQSTIRTESATGTGGVLLEETTNATERPRQQVGGVAGVGSNVALSDSSSGGAPSLSGASTASETSSETMRKYAPTLTREERVSVVPRVKRMSVALFVDESVPAEKVAELEKSVQAAVGFDLVRGDVFQRTALAFQVPETPETPEEELSGSAAPSPMMEMLLRRGVEIATALIFVVLLLKSLKGAKGTAPSPAAAASTGGDSDELDAELLARASVEELLRSDPDKVGEILSEWARGDELVGSGS
ncbi:MAG TPA: hypothetical protein ENJ09_00250 [Planctomycetes bacterium]|nr:hypothetical protein [Planctomycetota bacterium]